VNLLLKSVLSKSVLAVLALSVVLAGCGSAGSKSSLSGDLSIDGSSTLYPLTQAVAEEFIGENGKAKVTVKEAGTGTGMARFCAGEIKVADASREISDEEIAACKDKGIAYTAFKVALDGITVVVSKDNTWAKELTVAQLKSIFELNSKVKNWSDIPGSKGFPNEPIKLYTPGSASGTFEFFTEHINGTKKVQRTDSSVTQSEDDNVLVTGVSGDKYSIGYFGYGYYDENTKKVNAVSIIDAAKSDKAVTPNADTIADGSYTLSRPLFIYVANAALKDDKLVKGFVQFYLENASGLASDSYMVPLPDDQMSNEQDKL
jgi:phosphate transport system substrate-binding protein